MMNALMWTTQVMLALVFLAHGLVFLFPPQVVRKAKGQVPFSAAFLGFICAAEIVAAFGLTLPGLAGLLPWLIPLAATGLVPIMSGATVFHLSRRETAPALVTATLLALAALVAYARWFVIPL